TGLGTDNLEPIGHTHGRLIRKSEGTRLEGCGAEVGNLISQSTELKPEIQVRTRGRIETGTIYDHALRLLWKTRRAAVGIDSSGDSGVAHTISRRVRRSSCSCTIVSRTKQNHASAAFQERLDVARLAKLENVTAADFREVDRDGGNSAADRILL